MRLNCNTAKQRVRKPPGRPAHPRARRPPDPAGTGKEAALRRTWLAILGALALATTQASPGRAEAVVTFLHPEAFTDASLDGIRPASARSPALAALRRHLERLGQLLPPGQVLRIEILDVDLAGMPDPWASASHRPRLATPATWPRIRLRTTLEAPGAAPLHGEEEVTDRTYLRRSQAFLATGPLRYEQAMLDDWFERRFGAASRAGR